MTCKNKRDLFYFASNLNTNIYYIYRILKNRSYLPKRYHVFLIFEPKPRLVMSQCIVDKIVNHFVMSQYLLPYLESTLIEENVATRKNKGSSYAMMLVKKYIHYLLYHNPDKEIYCLKIDISKYFYTIDHEILLEKLEKRIKDKDVINLIKVIIKETNQEYVNSEVKYFREKYHVDIPDYQQGKGLSIGAMTSQFLAIYYLNDLDHYIKEKLKCKYYVRYMDDFLILDQDKERLKYIYREIMQKLEELSLLINKKSNLYRVSRGFSFLGYHYRVCHQKLKINCLRNTRVRINRKLSYLEKKDKVKYYRSIASYYGYFSASNSKKKGNFRMKTIDLYHAYKEKLPNCIVIIKEGIFYKTFEVDAKLLWYLFDYKYANGIISFGNLSYDKVIDKCI